ncbi:TlpA disulfide reductase family protein [Sphaerisporangium rhizosphaerae]
MTLALVRRIREHTKRLDDLSGMGPAGRLPAPGSPIGDFTAGTVHHEPVSRAMLDAGAVVGFFSPGCEPCRAALPGFLAHAGALRGGRDRVLAVVAGAEESDPMVLALAEVTRVVVEDHEGPVASAFGVRAFPTFCLVGPEASIAAARFDLSALTAPITV